MGFLDYFDLEHSGVAYAYEFLCEDSEFNCSELFKETAGDRTSRIKHFYIYRLDIPITRTSSRVLLVLHFFLAALASRERYLNCYYRYSLRSHKRLYRQTNKHNR